VTLWRDEDGVTALKSVSLPLLEYAESKSDAAIAMAMTLAERAGTELRVSIVAPPLFIPAMSYAGYTAATQMLMITEQKIWRDESRPKRRRRYYKRRR
jgi:hypothetical protein